MSAKQDLTGQKFGRLSVVADTGKRRHSYVVWLCRCDCGNVTEVISDSLKRGNTKSCGCLHDELAAERIKGVKTVPKHGLSHHRLFGIWSGMKTRCYNPNNKDFKDYGGRGITICAEWLADFQRFYDWAMKNGYQDSLTIDRKDVNGNYEPSNCKWATRAEQSRNQRRTHKNVNQNVG